jgi:hypothetical protein
LNKFYYAITSKVLIGCPQAASFNWLEAARPVTAVIGEVFDIFWIS